MVALEKIVISDEKSLEFIKVIYESSFPADERREFEKLKQLLVTHPDFNLMRIDKDGVPVGFFSFWKWDTFVYGEHFAIDDSCRGGGVGADTLRILLAQIAPLPMVLEVEKPEDEFSRRRIGFYQRLGFKLWPQHHYVQPPYAPDKNELEMYLMTAGDLDLDDELALVCEQIHSRVYNVKKK